MRIDYQNDDYDSIAAYRALSEVQPLLERAVSLNLFGAVGDKLPLREIKALISDDEQEADCFLEVLRCAGLLVIRNDFIANAPAAAKYLVPSSPHYCGALPAVNADFLWQRLASILGGTGKEFAVVEDFPFSVPHATVDGPPSIVLAGHLGEEALKICAEGGIVGVVGRFRANCGLNGAVALYQARRQKKPVNILDETDLAAFCEKHRLSMTFRVPLNSDFSAVFVATGREAFSRLALTREEQLIGELRTLDIRSIAPIDPAAVVVASWVRDHCRFGCSTYGEKCCPPHSPGYSETATRLEEYKRALLIEGQPPTGDFQRLMLSAEKTAFKAGYYKAFAYWAGPCGLCAECDKPAPPKKCTATRPSMESAGIDVFATVRGQGYALRTLKDKGELVKYFGLLLLE